MHNYGLWRIFPAHRLSSLLSQRVFIIRNLTSVPFPVPLQSPDNSKLPVSPIKESSNFRISVP